MTGHTHSLAEWFAFLLLGVSGHASFSVPYFLFVDASLTDFDPRPVVRRARPVVWDVTRSVAMYPLLREWDTARHVARLSLRDAAISLAALLVLLFPATGGTR